MSKASPILLVTLVVAAVLISAPVYAKKSPDYKAGFAAGKAAEIADEKTGVENVSVGKHPCTQSAEYCAGFVAGYKHEEAASFG
jgi:hypothetical protein